MRRHHLAAAILLLAATLLTPGAASAQVSIGLPYYAGGPSPWGYSYYPYGQGALSWPGAYSYTQRYYWYGYNWPYPGYFVRKYDVPPILPRGGATDPDKSSGSSSDRNSYYSYGAGADTARVTIRVPAADAEVWVEGKATQKRGLQRAFQSPRLDPSQKYVYEVRARWTENNRTVEQTRSVRVQVNDDAIVDFTASK